MICPKCKGITKDGSKFCRNCGEKINYCKNCGIILEDEGEFCDLCRKKTEKKQDGSESYIKQKNESLNLENTEKSEDINYFEKRQDEGSSKDDDLKSWKKDMDFQGEYQEEEVKSEDLKKELESLKMEIKSLKSKLNTENSKESEEDIQDFSEMKQLNEDENIDEDEIYNESKMDIDFLILVLILAAILIIVYISQHN